MEKELAAVFDCISEGVVYKDASGRIRLFNKAAEDILGLSREQAAGLTSQNHDWGMLHEDGSPCPGDQHPSVITLQSGQPLSNQVRGLPRPDGGVTWLSINTRPVFEPGQDQPSGVVISFRDIGQQKSGQDALRQSEERYRQLVRHAPAGIYEIDLATGQFLSVNDVMCLYTGYTREEFLATNALDILTPESAALFRERQMKVAAGQEVPPSVEFAIRAKDGGLFQVLLNVSVQRRPSGQMVASVVAHDITQGKRMEEALRARLRLMELGAAGSVKDLLRKTLDEVGALVESPIGFFHLVEPDQKTLRLQAWSTRTTNEFCASQGDNLHYGLDQAGVWVDCVHQRRPVVHNDYAGLSHRKGLPQGHARVVRELVVPILREGRIVAILGVGNKPRHYTGEDVALVSRLADWSWDIAQRKQTEEELRRNHQRLGVALATVDLAVFQQDRDLRYTWMYKPQLGYDASQVVGHTDAELLPAQDAALVTEIKRGVVASGLGARQEVPVTTPEGTLTFDLVVEPLRDQDGAVVGVAGASLNITGRKRVEEALRLSEEKFRLAFQMSPLAMTITRLADGKVLLINEAHQNIFGNAPQEIEGRTTAELDVWVNPDDRRRLVEQLKAHGLCRDFRTAIRDKNGQGLTISINCTAIEYAGEPCILSVLQDLTQSIKAEREQRAMEAQLRQAHKMQAVGTLAAGVAHEFNNLLAVIMGYAELVRDEAQGRRDILDDLAPILTACQRGRDLVKQLAAFSRQTEPQARPLNLNQQIAATGEILARLLPRAVAVHTSLAPELPIVGMDAGHFQQVLIALANNAAQAMPAGGRLDIETASVTLGPTVCATCGETFSGDFVLLKVRDSGPGMEPETARRVFEPFFTSKGVGGGVGLGLSVTQGTWAGACWARRATRC
ncbi:MAG: PAS domain S-box protein [Desulfarculus sp.]|nr:PAS domain S-box protein [Desulfarculus sp.]